jgi:hypothetical protein
VDKTFSGLYLNSLKNTGPWGECIRRQAQLAQLIQRDREWCANLQNQLRSDRPWWKFW